MPSRRAWIPVAVALGILVGGIAVFQAPAAVVGDLTRPHDASEQTVCARAPAQLLEWTGPAGAPPAPVSSAFHVAAGSRDLHLAWTDPTAPAASHDIRITAPDGTVIFERALAPVPSGPNVAFSLNNMVRSVGPEDDSAPMPGEYGFLADVRGAMPGAALRVSVAECA